MGGCCKGEDKGNIAVGGNKPKGKGEENTNNGTASATNQEGQNQSAAQDGALASTAKPVEQK